MTKLLFDPTLTSKVKIKSVRARSSQVKSRPLQRISRSEESEDFSFYCKRIYRNYNLKFDKYKFDNLTSNFYVKFCVYSTWCPTSFKLMLCLPCQFLMQELSWDLQWYAKIKSTKLSCCIQDMFRVKPRSGFKSLAILCEHLVLFQILCKTKGHLELMKQPIAYYLIVDVIRAQQHISWLYNKSQYVYA